MQNALALPYPYPTLTIIPATRPPKKPSCVAASATIGFSFVAPMPLLASIPLRSRLAYTQEFFAFVHIRNNTTTSICRFSYKSSKKLTYTLKKSFISPTVYKVECNLHAQSPNNPSKNKKPGTTNNTLSPIYNHWHTKIHYEIWIRCNQSCLFASLYATIYSRLNIFYFNCTNHKLNNRSSNQNWTVGSMRLTVCNNDGF